MKLKLYCVPVIIFYAMGLFSAPRLINDNRIEDLNGFPSPGRGYSITSNRLQSMCFKSIVTSKPTFDLNYDIEEVSGDYLNRLRITGKNRIQNEKLNTFLKNYYATEEYADNKKYIIKNLIVRAEINQYYYSMDETQSGLSESVKEMLKKKQFVTFFNSCGHFYVRSVGTFSTYYALLQYRLTGDKDEEFRNELEKGLFNFYEEAQAATGKEGKVEVRKGKAPSEEYEKLSEHAEYRGLKVYVQGIGLSKGDPVNLIPINIKQFRITIQEAVKLMQDPDSGLVSSIEVVPWMENPEFGKIMLSDLEEEGGARQFIRQQNIEENTGVINEIYRKSNEQVELYNVASMCRKVIVDHYADKSEGSVYRQRFGYGIKPAEKKKEFTLLDQSIIRQIVDYKIKKYDGVKTLFYNLSNENDKSGYISINDYLNYFYAHPPEEYLKINDFYLNGDPEKKGDGALDCINRLYKDLESKSYRDIPICRDALRDVELDSTFLNQYCLPKPVRVFNKGEELRDTGAGTDSKRINGNNESGGDGSAGDIIKRLEGDNKKDDIRSFDDVNKGDGSGKGDKTESKDNNKKGDIESFDDIKKEDSSGEGDDPDSEDDKENFESFDDLKNK